MLLTVTWKRKFIYILEVSLYDLQVYKIYFVFRKHLHVLKVNVIIGHIQKPCGHYITQGILGIFMKPWWGPGGANRNHD